MRVCHLLFALPVLGLLLAGCPPSGIYEAPNDLPMAVARVVDADSDQAISILGYTTLGSEATLDGSQSYDPDGRPSSDIRAFSWGFEVAPDDSELTDEHLVPGVDDPSRASFLPDVVGTYRLWLEVEDRRGGRSAPAPAIVQVLPADLVVELEWQTVRADLDLHLLAPGGSYFGDGDCFSWNPNPDWGLDDIASDDPALEADVDGEGPAPYRERIAIEEPGPGSWLVAVHYYSDHGAALGSPAIVATAGSTIEVAGRVIAEDVAPPGKLVQGDVWLVGEVMMPEGLFVPWNQLSDHEAQGGPPYND
jgi:hypothetical protein